MVRGLAQRQEQPDLVCFDRQARRRTRPRPPAAARPVPCGPSGSPTSVELTTSSASAPTAAPVWPPTIIPPIRFIISPRPPRPPRPPTIARISGGRSAADFAGSSLSSPLMASTARAAMGSHSLDHTGRVASTHSALLHACAVLNAARELGGVLQPEVGKPQRLGDLGCGRSPGRWRRPSGPRSAWRCSWPGPSSPGRPATTSGQRTGAGRPRTAAGRPWGPWGPSRRRARAARCRRRRRSHRSRQGPPGLRAGAEAEGRLSHVPGLGVICPISQAGWKGPHWPSYPRERSAVSNRVAQVRHERSPGRHPGLRRPPRAAQPGERPLAPALSSPRRRGSARRRRADVAVGDRLTATRRAARPETRWPLASWLTATPTASN